MDHNAAWREGGRGTTTEVVIMGDCVNSLERL